MGIVGFMKEVGPIPVAMGTVCLILRDRGPGFPTSRPRGAWLLSLGLRLEHLASEVPTPHPSHTHTYTCTVGEYY